MTIRFATRDRGSVFVDLWEEEPGLCNDGKFRSRFVPDRMEGRAGCLAAINYQFVDNPPECEKCVPVQWFEALTIHSAADDSCEPITPEWIESLRPSECGIGGYSLLLPQARPGVSIIEVRLMPDDDGSWDVSLIQNAGCEGDVSDHEDHVAITSREFRTRGDVRELFRGLGAPLKETP